MGNETSQVAQTVKHLPTVWETQVQSLDREDPLEKAMAPHSSILAWKILGTEEPGGLQCMGHRELENEWPWVSPSEECSDELRYEKKGPIYLCNPLLETLS